MDAIYVYDTGSEDGTQQIAEAQGAKVTQGEWKNDFSWARNRSYELGEEDSDWIVYADADDTVDGLEQLRPLAEDAISSVGAFSFPYHNDWSGIPVRYHTIRMVRAKAGYRWRYPLHEQLYTSESGYRTVELDSPIWSQKHTWKDRQRKTQRNLDFLLAYYEEHPLDDWGASAIVLTMIEQGRAREAYAWMVKEGYTMDIRRMDMVKRY